MSFTKDPTRQIEAGDTPGFDDEVLSRLMSVADIPKGIPCIIEDGIVTIATAAIAPGQTPFVPVESKDNDPQLNLEIKGITATQRVAMKYTEDGTINPGDYVEVDTAAGELQKWQGAINNTRYARYLGKEAGVFSRGDTSPYKEDLSKGVVPDQALTQNQIGWFQLVEAGGN